MNGTATVEPMSGAAGATPAPAAGSAVLTVPAAPALEIREGRPSDVNFVFATWLRCYRRSGFAHAVLDRIYYHYHHLVIEHVLRSGRLLVAHPPGEPDVILGYMVLGPESVLPGETAPRALVHWCYVKKTLRRFGVAKALSLAGGVGDRWIFTHRTAEAEPVIRGHDAVYVPWLL